MRRKCIPEGTYRVKRRCDKSMLFLEQAEKRHFCHSVEGKNSFPFPAGVQDPSTEIGLTASTPLAPSSPMRKQAKSV